MVFTVRHELQGAFFLLCAHRHKARARVHDPSLGSSCVAHSRGTGLQSFVIKGVNLDRLIGLFCTERADWRIVFYLPLVKSYMATMQHCWQAVRSILCTGGSDSFSSLAAPQRGSRRPSATT